VCGATSEAKPSVAVLGEHFLRHFRRVFDEELVNGFGKVVCRRITYLITVPPRQN